MVAKTGGHSARKTSLPDEDLAGIVKLIKSSDSVELKLTVPASEHRSTGDALEVDPVDGQIRQVFFFDTPDLKLDKVGLVVRARRIQGKTGDTVVKLRPLVPEEVPGELRKSRTFSIEVDAMPGGYVCSGSLKGVVDSKEPREVAAGRRAIRKLFSKEQRAFYAAHAPEGIGLDDLSVLGPINLFKLKFAPKEFRRRMVAELWMYPDNSRILELSTKCLPSETFDVAVEARAFLSANGVDLSGAQQTKTKTALQFFSRQLAAPAAQAQARKERHDGPED
jgi:hypothetical protein